MKNFPQKCRQIQPVPEKMRLEMLVGMQIEILNGGEILVTCKFKLARGGEAPRRSCRAPSV